MSSEEMVAKWEFKFKMGVMLLGDVFLGLMFSFPLCFLGLLLYLHFVGFEAVSVRSCIASSLINNEKGCFSLILLVLGNPRW